jgi:hypothetical protein
MAYVESLLTEPAYLANGAEALRLADAIESARRIAVAERRPMDRLTRAATPPESDRA